MTNDRMTSLALLFVHRQLAEYHLVSYQWLDNRQEEIARYMRSRGDDIMRGIRSY